MAIVKDLLIERLEKDIDREIKVALLASKGGRLRKYTDFYPVNGATKVIYIGTEGNYSETLPNLMGAAADTITGLSGGVNKYELSPKPIYSYEQFPYEDTKQILEVNQDTWFVKNLTRALEIAEDIKIIKEVEAADAAGLIPALNTYTASGTLTITDAKVIEKFKAMLAYAATLNDGEKTEAKANAVAVMNAQDWGLIILRNDTGHIFSSEEYRQVAGLNGNGTVMSYVCGCRLETFTTYRRAYGDAGVTRNYIVNPGTTWIISSGAIATCAWDNSVRSEVQHMMANGDKTTIVVSKSFGAKVIQPEGIFKLSYTAKPINQEDA